MQTFSLTIKVNIVTQQDSMSPLGMCLVALKIQHNNNQIEGNLMFQKSFWNGRLIEENLGAYVYIN